MQLEHRLPDQMIASRKKEQFVRNEKFPQDKAGHFKIVHAAETSGGGIASYLTHMMSMQLEQFGPGSVTAIVPQSQSQFLRSLSGIEVVTFDDRFGRTRNAFRLANLLKDFVRNRQPDIVHLHSTFAGAVLRPMLRHVKSSAKIIYCPHGWAFDRKMKRYARYGAKWVERKLARFCDAIVCISHYEVQAARLCGIPAEKLVLVRNGVPKVAPIPEIDPTSIDWPIGKRRILFVGRFDRQKGVDVLLNAVAELKDQVYAVIIGGSVVGDLSVASMPENVRLCDWMTPAQLEPFYMSADVVVIPSRWEGFGLVAVEAMRAGVAVIASNVGGLAEIVEDGVTGILIPVDDEKILRDTLRNLSDTQLQAMGKAGRERFLREFTMERTHRQLCDLYLSSERSVATSSLLPQR